MQSYDKILTFKKLGLKFLNRIKIKNCNVFSICNDSHVFPGK